MLFLFALAGCTTSGPSDRADAQAPQDGTGNGTADAQVTNPDGSLPSTQAVTIIVEPNGQHGNELVAAIAAATQSVYMTMYEMSDADVVNALVARKQAGLDVQVILDGSSSNRSFNTSSYNTLHSAAIAVVWSNPTFTYTHEKTVIIDGTSAWIMTMNANTSSPNDNREYLAIDTDPADVAEATAVFKADHAMTSITPTGDLVVADANARAKLVTLIDGAQTTLDVEGEEFSDTTSNGIVPAVARAARRGVRVHVVIANGNANANAIALVKNSGGSVVVTGPRSGNGSQSNPYIHAKAIVVDCGTAATCARAYVGSENFSAGSLGYNRELGVIFDTASELKKVKTAIDLDFAAGTAQ